MQRFWTLLIEWLLWIVFLATTIMGIASAATLSDPLSARAAAGTSAIVVMYAAWPWFLIAVIALAAIGVMTAIDRMRFEMTGRK